MFIKVKKLTHVSVKVALSKTVNIMSYICIDGENRVCIRKQRRVAGMCVERGEVQVCFYLGVHYSCLN